MLEWTDTNVGAQILDVPYPLEPALSQVERTFPDVCVSGHQLPPVANLILMDWGTEFLPLVQAERCFVGN